MRVVGWNKAFHRYTWGHQWPIAHRIAAIPRTTLENMDAGEFDRRFDDGEDVTDQLDVTAAQRPGKDATPGTDDS